MKISLPALLIGALSLSSGLFGGTIMPLPGQSSTFGPDVRGYWFQAPVSFNIVSLFIPTDASSAAMSIEVVRLDAVPPNYSATTNAFTSLFRTVNDASVSAIPVNIPVLAGEYIGILGQRGTVNSYGSGDFVTDIFGSPVTLRRLGMQLPLTTNLAQNLWTESGRISRVQMEYDVYNASSSVPEPATFLLTAAAGALIAFRRRR